MKHFFTSEAVTEGHPDKVADRIADSILDELLKQDPYSRVACEVVTCTDLVFIFGQITTNAVVDYEKIARDTVKEIGYDKAELGFSYDTMKVNLALEEQSLDIKIGVDEGENKELGAGDQGIMFGYATKETPSYLPLAYDLAQKLAYRLTEARKSHEIDYLRPDGKTQVTIEYDDDKIKRIDTILVSCQHNPDVTLDQIRKDVIEKIINKIVPMDLVDKDTKILVNPTGKFIIGGPKGDSGLTGRKIIVDTYGGYSKNGGGALSGKDATKVDRAASYYLRYIAKNLVASGLAEKIELQVSYAIGVSKPVSLYVDTFNTSKFTSDELSKIISENFDLRPASMIKELGLREPIFKETSCYGHFRDNKKVFPWERLDKVDSLKKYL